VTVLGSEEWLDGLVARLAAVAVDDAADVKVRHEVGDRHWTVVLRDGRATLDRNGIAPDVTFSTDATTASEIADGVLSPQDAFGTGRLRVGGDLKKLVEAAPVLGAALGRLERSGA